MRNEASIELYKLCFFDGTPLDFGNIFSPKYDVA